jgi:hypothetical protein
VRIGKNHFRSKEVAAKISATMKAKKLDNFTAWRTQKQLARPTTYFRLEQNSDLAELIGVVLGDGYIGAHARTEVLRIACNNNNQGFIRRYSMMVERVFSKKPTVKKRTTSECVDIVMYEKGIAARLGLATGAKTHRPFVLPIWISTQPEYVRAFLRGLYETDGCHAIHRGTYTYKFIFSNVNQSLLELVFMLLCELGFHPTKTEKTVQLSRKAEVSDAVALLSFRKY